MHRGRADFFALPIDALRGRRIAVSPYRRIALTAVFRSQILDPVLSLGRLTRCPGHEIIR